MYGTDPDAAEDLTDSNAETISRQRRKNEICCGLKRSGIIKNAFIYRNITEIVFLIGFIIFNIGGGLAGEQNLEPAVCVLEVSGLPYLGLPGRGILTFHCEGKKVHFFLGLLYIQLGLLGLVLACCITSLGWVLAFRLVNIMWEKLRGARQAGEPASEAGAGGDWQ